MFSICAVQKSCFQKNTVLFGGGANPVSPTSLYIFGLTRSGSPKKKPDALFLETGYARLNCERRIRLMPVWEYKPVLTKKGGTCVSAKIFEKSGAEHKKNELTAKYESYRVFWRKNLQRNLKSCGVEKTTGFFEPSIQQNLQNFRKFF